MKIERAGSSVLVEIYSCYAQGQRRIAMGAVHRDQGTLTVLRLQGRFGTVPVLEMKGSLLRHLYEPRIVDMINSSYVVSGLERTRDESWVAQEWWVRQTSV